MQEANGGGVLLLLLVVVFCLFLFLLFFVSSTLHDRWTTADDRWTAADDRRTMANDRRTTTDDRWTMANDRWTQANHGTRCNPLLPLRKDMLPFHNLLLLSLLLLGVLLPSMSAGATTGIAVGGATDGADGDKDGGGTAGQLIGKKRARLMPTRPFEKVTPEAGENDRKKIGKKKEKKTEIVARPSFFMVCDYCVPEWNKKKRERAYGAPLLLYVRRMFFFRFFLEAFWCATSFISHVLRSI